MNKAEEFKQIANEYNKNKCLQEAVQRTYSSILKEIKKEAEKGYYSYSVPYQFTIQKEFSYVEKILEKDGFDISYEYDFEEGYEYWEISWR